MNRLKTKVIAIVKKRLKGMVSYELKSNSKT